MAFHEDIDRLIPWYVNGTLNEAERDTVNRHLGGCPTCTAAVGAEVRFARSMRADPAGMRNFPPADSAVRDFSARLPRQHPKWQSASAAMLMSLTLAVAGGSFLAGQHLQRPVFETMTAPAMRDGPVVQLMFDPSAPENLIRRVVRDAGGTVIAGPTATGIYRISLPDGSDGRAQADRLRNLPVVRWVSLEDP